MSLSEQTPGERLFYAMVKHQTGTTTAEFQSWHNCTEKNFCEAVAAEFSQPLLDTIAGLQDHIQWLTNLGPVDSE